MTVLIYWEQYNNNLEFYTERQNSSFVFCFLNASQPRVSRTSAELISSQTGDNSGRMILKCLQFIKQMFATNIQQWRTVVKYGWIKALLLFQVCFSRYIFGSSQYCNDPYPTFKISFRHAYPISVLHLIRHPDIRSS